MTNEQINISIAVALGKAVEWHDGVPYWLGMWSSVGEGNESFAEFNPAYDLNAMHEAEKMLVGRNNWELCDYVQRLHTATTSWIAFATASQRAEAFLKTLGKWEDAK